MIPKKNVWFLFLKVNFYSTYLPRHFPESIAKTKISYQRMICIKNKLLIIIPKICKL